MTAFSDFILSVLACVSMMHISMAVFDPARHGRWRAVLGLSMWAFWLCFALGFVLQRVWP